MDIVVYLVAAAILIVLIIFAVRIRGSTTEGESKTSLKKSRQVYLFIYVFISQKAKR